jgi:hypothetical protein
VICGGCDASITAHNSGTQIPVALVCVVYVPRSRMRCSDLSCLRFRSTARSAIAVIGVAAALISARIVPWNEPTGGDDAGPCGGNLGGERRWYVLRYLREHPPPPRRATQSHAEHADPAAHSLIIIARDEILTIKIDYRGAARVPCLTMTRQAIACEQQDQDGPSNERTCAERVM